MNSRQARKRSREFLREVLSILPAEYNAELTKLCLEQAREIEVLTNQLMKRDGYVIHSIGEG
jgi:hypothetical protein